MSCQHWKISYFLPKSSSNYLHLLPVGVFITYFFMYVPYLLICYCLSAYNISYWLVPLRAPLYLREIYCVFADNQCNWVGVNGKFHGGQLFKVSVTSICFVFVLRLKKVLLAILLKTLFSHLPEKWSAPCNSKESFTVIQGTSWWQYFRTGLFK